jgi:ribose transport system permease protein
VVAAALIALGGAVALARTVPGRQILALGGSPRSAVETGIPIQRVLLLVYGLAGFCGAASGLIVVGRVGVIIRT